MKKTTLALSIITAFSLWGCVGSSSSDDQPIDQGNSQQQHHINPSQNTDDNNNNDNGNSGNAGSSGSAGGASGHISGGSAGGQPIADDDSSDDDKTGGNDNNDNDDSDNGSDVIPTVEEANATLDKIAKELAEKTATETVLKGELSALQSANSKAQTDLQAAKTKTNYANDAAKEAAIAAAKIVADKAAAAEAAKQEEVNAAKNEVTKVTAERDVADKGVEISEAQYVNYEPQSKIDALRAEQAKIKATAIQTVADAKLEAAKKVLGADDSKGIKKEVKEAKDAFDTARDQLDNKSGEDYQKALAAVGEAQAKYDAVVAKKNQAEETVAKLTAESDEAEAAAETAERDATNATEIDKNRGLIGDAQNLSLSSFQDVATITRIIREGKKANSVWNVTFKNGEKLVIDKSAIAVGKNWIGTSKANSNDNIYYGDIDNKGNAIRTYTDLAFGYLGDKFFSVGQKTPESEVKDSLNGVSYTGTAFLKTTDNKDLVSDVTASVTFDENEKSLKGKFFDFKTYDREKISSTGPLEGESTNTADYKDSEGKTMPAVQFSADIFGNRFKAQNSENDGKASVYGYFYGNGAETFGGLVEYSKFHGSFGAKKKPK